MFEYKVEMAYSSTPEILEKHLNELANEGWMYVNTLESKMIFVRPKQEKKQLNEKK